ncbi:MAG: ABC transporter ATP-binding protein [Alphaproteobacteria bacterium]
MSEVLRLIDVTKRFGPLLANDHISLSLKEGEVLALLGENGAGKTTLVNIIFGHYTADEGSVEAFGKPLPPGQPEAALQAGIGMVHQHFSLADNLTVLENITLGSESLWSWRRKLKGPRERIARLARDFGLQVDPKARIADLSVGERQRVEILKALYREAKILILDEPTAVLTPQETETLFATLRRLVDKGMSIIFISHKLNEIMRVSDRVAVLRRGKVVAETRTSEADRAGLAEMMVGRAVHDPKGKPMAPGETLFELKKVSVGRGQGFGVLEEADLVIHRHEIVGLAGVSGNGQQALAGLISGLAHPDAGTMRLFGKDAGRTSPAAMIHQGVGRIPEDRHAVGVVGEMQVWENLIAERRRDPGFSKFGWFNFKSIKAQANRLIEAYDIRCQGMGAETRLLSGGNIQKLILARVLDHDPSIILADQPARGLDVGAIAYVHGKLLEARKRGAGILLISEDLDELRGLADRIVVIYRGRLSQPLEARKATLARIGLMMSGQAEAA